MFRSVGENLKDRFDGASRVMLGNSGGLRRLKTKDQMLNKHNGDDEQPQEPEQEQQQQEQQQQEQQEQQQQQEQQEEQQNEQPQQIVAGGDEEEDEDGNGTGRGKGRYGFRLKPYNPELKVPGAKDLVYLEPSPGFCDPNPRLGVLGTRGRVCNETSIGVDGCDLMCCGRGYKTQQALVSERCNCTFLWCCQVKCSVCQYRKTINTCV